MKRLKIGVFLGAASAHYQRDDHSEFTYPVYNPRTAKRCQGSVRGIMRTLKIVALGTLLSVVEIVGYLLFRVLTGITRASISTGHATGLSAVLGGLIEATISDPMCWLLIALSFGLAFWITGKSHAAPHQAEGNRRN